MKHVGELAIIGASVNLKQAVFAPREVALILQSVGFFIGFCCTHITIARVVELACLLGKFARRPFSLHLTQGYS